MSSLDHLAQKVQQLEALLLGSKSYLAVILYDADPLSSIDGGIVRSSYMRMTSPD